MSETKHTPGPWRRDGYVIKGPEANLDVAIVYRPAIGNAPMSEEEAEANARMMVAAPFMLTMLQTIYMHASILNKEGLRDLSGDAISLALTGKYRDGEQP